MKLIIQIPCLNEEETLPATLRDLPRQVAGLRRGRVAGHRRRLDRPHHRGRARARRRPHRAPDEQQGPGLRLPGGARRRAEARRRRDRQHRRRQPVLRRRHPQARRSRSSRGDADMVVGDREVDDDRALLAAEEGAAAARLVGRAAGVADHGAGHDLGLPRLQPRGRAAACRSSRTTRTRSRRSSRRARCRRGRPRPDHDERRRRASRGCSRRCGRTSAATASRSSASTRCTSRCGCSCSAAIVIGLVALVVWGRFFYFFAFEGEGGGHVQSLILGAVLFNAAMRARRARRHRRPALRPADHAAAHVRARAADRARARRPALALRARRSAESGREPTTGAHAGRRGQTEEREAVKL